MSVATKARELLTDLQEVANSCPHCGGKLSDPEGRYISLETFDPMHGQSELTYARSRGFIEHDPANPIRVRLTGQGRLHLSRKPRSDSDAGKARGEKQ